MRRAAFIVLAALLCARSAAATTYHVAKTGVDMGRVCGTAVSASTPLLTVTKGLTCLAAGDTLLVHTGTYVEAISNNIASGTTWNNKVRIAAYPDGCAPSLACDTVTLRPASGHWVIYFGSDAGDSAQNPQFIEFDGIRIDGSNIDDAPVFLDTRGLGTPNHIRIQNAHVQAPASGADGIFRTGQSKAAVTVGGHNCDKGTCDGSIASWNEIINLEIEGTSGPYGVYITGDNNLVENCNIHDVSSLGVHVYDNDHNRVPQNNTIRGNLIHHLSEAWNFTDRHNQLGGMLVFGDGNRMYNNVIYDISLAAGFGTPSPWGGIYLYSGGDNRIVGNNTIYGVQGSAVYVTGGSGAVVKNNIFYQNGFDGVETGGSSGTSVGNNLLGSNPQFTNLVSRDFTLSSGSAGIAINTGTPMNAYYTTDALGATRPVDGAWDMGAYEFGGVIVGACSPVSASGDRVPLTTASICDPGGNTWTMGTGVTPFIQIVLNGSPMSMVFGAQELLCNSTFYVQGDDLGWYSWNGTSFLFFGSSDPCEVIPVSGTPGLRVMLIRLGLVR